MKIQEVRSWKEAVRLTRPYAIAGRRIESVDLFYVEIESETEVGLGSASPSPSVTGESPEACASALDAAADLLRGEEATHIGRLQQLLGAHLSPTPGARAALDMALWDAFAKGLGVPLVDLWGIRRQTPIATSITVGIQSVDQALADAREYLERGFRILKIKIGDDFDADMERLEALRALADEMAGPNAERVEIRVDGNRGFDMDELRRLAAEAHRLGLELIEQPLPPSGDAALRELPRETRSLLAADESLVEERDALKLLYETPFHHWNLKLMKHGGPTPARHLAHLAHTAGLGLMWGCMDESVVSIAAALHAAYASPATQRLDLDGSFDLADDRAIGGFRLENGHLHVLDEPGLGVSWR